MPKYEYDCPRCGRFADYRPMAEYSLPAACPDCGTQAPRAALSFPAMSTQTARGRAAPGQFSAGSGHAPGCRCCGNIKVPREEWTRKLL
jgi:putative FmdB family regulatory protein